MKNNKKITASADLFPAARINYTYSTKHFSERLRGAIQIVMAACFSVTPVVPTLYKLKIE